MNADTQIGLTFRRPVLCTSVLTMQLQIIDTNQQIFVELTRIYDVEFPDMTIAHVIRLVDGFPGYTGRLGADVLTINAKRKFLCVMH